MGGWRLGNRQRMSPAGDKSLGAHLARHKVGLLTLAKLYEVRLAVRKQSLM